MITFASLNQNNLFFMYYVEIKVLLPSGKTIFDRSLPDSVLSDLPFASIIESLLVLFRNDLVTIEVRKPNKV